MGSFMMPGATGSQNKKKSTRKRCGNNPAESAVSPLGFRQKMPDPGEQKVQTMN